MFVVPGVRDGCRLVRVPQTRRGDEVIATIINRPNNNSEEKQQHQKKNRMTIPFRVRSVVIEAAAVGRWEIQPRSNSESASIRFSAAAADFNRDGVKREQPLLRQLHSHNNSDDSNEEFSIVSDRNRPPLTV